MEPEDSKSEEEEHMSKLQHRTSLTDFNSAVQTVLPECCRGISTFSTSEDCGLDLMSQDFVPAREPDPDDPLAEVFNVNPSAEVFKGVVDQSILQEEVLRRRTSIDFLFIEAVRDSFLSQLVNEPTRARGTNTPSLLDLVLANEEALINSVKTEEPIGKSDHVVLQITANFIVKDQYPGARRNYDKANYT